MTEPKETTAQEVLAWIEKVAPGDCMLDMRQPFSPREWTVYRALRIGVVVESVPVETLDGWITHAKYLSLGDLEHLSKFLRSLARVARGQHAD